MWSTDQQLDSTGINLDYQKILLRLTLIYSSPPDPYYTPPMKASCFHFSHKHKAVNKIPGFIYLLHEVASLTFICAEHHTEGLIALPSPSPDPVSHVSPLLLTNAVIIPKKLKPNVLSTHVYDCQAVCKEILIKH